VDLGDIVRTLEYARAYWTQTDLPSQGEADQCLLAATIDVATWECWTRANDTLVSPHAAVLRSQRTRPTTDQVIAAERRGFLTGPEAADRLRQQGFLDQSDVDLVTRLATGIPSALQAFGYISATVFDDNLAQRYQLDFGRDAVKAPPFAEWVNAANLTPDTLTALYRGHWTPPALGELIQGVRRLVPGQAPPGLEVTTNDVRYFLSVANVHPWWRERALALANLPLGRREANQAYQFGAIDSAGALKALQATGYDESTSQVVLATYQARQKNHFRSSRWLKLYEESAISKGECLQRLAQDGCPEGLASQLVAEAGAVIAATSRGAVVKAIHRHYVGHGLTALQVQDQLGNLGLDAEQVQTLLTGWTLELTSAPREVSAGEIMQWLENGLITTDEAAYRLQLAGYTPQDAGRIIARAGQLVSARQAARAAKTAAETKRQAAQVAKTEERLQRQQDSAARARAKKAQRQAALVERQARSRAVTIRLLAARRGSTQAQAEDELMNQAARIEATYQLAPGEAWDALKAAVHGLPRKGDFDLTAAVNAAAEAERDVLLQLAGQGGGNGQGG
jgi:hypothetical protein